MVEATGVPIRLHCSPVLPTTGFLAGLPERCGGRSTGPPSSPNLGVRGGDRQAHAHGARAPLAAQPPAYPVVDLHVDLSYQYNFKGKEFADAVGQFHATAVTRGGAEGIAMPQFGRRNASTKGPSQHAPRHSARSTDAEQPARTTTGMAPRNTNR